MRNVVIRSVAWTLLAFVIGFMVQTAIGQPSDDKRARTATECLTSLQQYPSKQAEAAKKAGQPMSYRVWQKEAKELGKQCSTSFTVAETSGSDLIPLSKLYLSTDQPQLAREAIGKRLKTPDLTETEKAEALVAAIGVVMSGTPTDVDMKQGEDYTKQVDALSDAQLKSKFDAHSRMAGWYGYADMDAPNIAHHSMLIELIDRMPPEDRAKNAVSKANAYDHIALVQANRGQTDKAIATLQKAKTDGADPRMLPTLDAAIERYSMIGKRVTPLKANYWINSTSTKELDPAGKVTLIQFTAHWCVPCRKSYPAMMKMYEKYGSKGLEVMMATELYGYFEDRSNLKPDEELAADRDYYIDHHKLPFKIAVENRVDYADRSPAAEAARKELNSSKYHVGGIPQIMLLDKNGLVRHIMVGWDPANEEMITREIEQLLKEKAAPASK